MYSVTASAGLRCHGLLPSLPLQVPMLVRWLLDAKDSNSEMCECTMLQMNLICPAGSTASLNPSDAQNNIYTCECQNVQVIWPGVPPVAPMSGPGEQ